MTDYDPCVAHSLNLVGTCAAEPESEGVDFFDTLQELYIFLYNIHTLLEHFGAAYKFKLKSLSQIRWSARHEACYALENEWYGIRGCNLQSISVFKFI